MTRFAAFPLGLLLCLPVVLAASGDSMQTALRNEVLGPAVDYLVGNFNETIGLIRESPDDQFKDRYWLYSDNYLASLVLSTYDPSNVTLKGMARDISANVDDYLGLAGIADPINQYRALNQSVSSFNASLNFNLTSMTGVQGAEIWITLNNQSGPLTSDDYADIAFLKAIYYVRIGDVNSAMIAYVEGVTHYDGKGFRDRPFTDINSTTMGQYQTCKLALYIHAAELLGQIYDQQALYTILSMQQPNGGFSTSYDTDLNEFPGTNTETTSLVILALMGDTVAPDLLMTTPVIADNPDQAFYNCSEGLEWVCSDDYGIAAQEVKIDDFGWQVASSPFPLNLQDGNHTVQVRVTDFAGNQALESITFYADRTPPTVTITSPIDGAMTKSQRIEWSARDNTAIFVPFLVNVDNNGWVSPPEGGVFHYDLDVPDGQHVVQVRTFDSAHNVGTATVHFTLDRIAPSLTVLSPSEGSTVRDSEVTVSWQALDSVGMKEILIGIDGRPDEVAEGNGSAVLTLGNGPHTITVTAVDQAGNTNTVFRSFTVDEQSAILAYGLLTAGGIVAVAVLAVVALMLRRRRKGGRAVATVPKED